MKKLLLTASSLFLVNSAFATDMNMQDKDLSHWMEKKESMHKMVHEAKQVNKHLPKDEGIACVKMEKHHEYEVLVHRHVMGKSKDINDKNFDEVYTQFWDAVKDKEMGGDAMVSYQLHGMDKEAHVFKVNHHEMCAAYWPKK